MMNAMGFEADPPRALARAHRLFTRRRQDPRSQGDGRALAASLGGGQTPAGDRIEHTSLLNGHTVSAGLDVSADEGVVIELSPAQIDQVLSGAAESGDMSVLLSGLQDVREVLAREPRQLEDNRLSRSLLAGLLMLASFPTDGSDLGNAEIARMLDMNPSTTHRYVSTLVAVGLLERDPATRRYRLA
jgi:hypothetical protein